MNGESLAMIRRCEMEVDPVGWRRWLRSAWLRVHAALEVAASPEATARLSWELAHLHGLLNQMEARQ